MTRTYSEPLPWSATTHDFVMAGIVARACGKVRRVCECVWCARVWETEFDDSGEVQTQWFQCQCGRDQEITYEGKGR